jgi:hypothetical protein
LLTNKKIEKIVTPRMAGYNLISGTTVVPDWMAVALDFW